MTNHDQASKPPNPRRPVVPGSGVITALDAVQADGDSRIIKVEGHPIATLLESDVVRLGLCLDGVLTPELAEQIAFHHECRLAWKASIQRLTRSGRSVLDIRNGLQRRGHEEAVIDRVVSALKHDGYLDDAQFAASAAASLARRSPASASFIENRLLQHGIAAEEAEKAAKNAAGDPVDAATALAAKALRSLDSCSPETRIRRIHGRLARRGFEADVIAEALRRVDLDISE
ncbi:MAG: RecX family transcriptional regulator [Planctomycetota bacterium]|nr:RecX family transcriptional regulator [Planctomycetota bacterium]